MLSRKGGLLVVTLVAFALLAVWADSRTLALACLPVLVALGAGLAQAMRAPPRLVVRARLPQGRLLAGDVARVEMTLSASGRMDLAEVVFEPRAGVEVARGAPARLARLSSPRDEEHLELEVTFGVRGFLDAGRVRWRSRSPFGVLVEEGEARIPGEVTVVPRREDLDAVSFLRRGNRPRSASVSLSRPGAGQDFFGLRGYRSGDPIDHVNWRKTAKLGRPIVNEFEMETPTDVVLVLDARLHADFGLGASSTLEASIRGVISVAERALDQRSKVGLLVLGRQMYWVHPAMGRQQQARIEEQLLVTEPGGAYDLDLAFETLPPGVLPRGALVILFTPAHPESASLDRAIGSLTARRVHPLIVAPSPQSSESAMAGAPPLAGAVARIVHVERAEMLDALRRQGASVVDWDVSEPLASAFARSGVAW